MNPKKMKDKIFSISLILIGITLIIGLSQYLLPPQQISPKETQQILLQPRQKETQQRSFTAFPPLPKRQRNLAYLVVGGDIMFSRNIGYRNKKQGYDRIFGSGNFNPISKFTKCKVDNCVLFFNLESLFHTKDNDIQMGGFTFRANPDNIEVLKQLRTPTEQQQSNEWGRNFPMTLSLTNNHTNNVGYEGILTTQDTLHAGGDF
ncbi:MAG: CapA family protein [Candidatus Peribacteria bacterium]|jgi:hypothetical protein|nr:CapA family protein [Candidatus Peribacteria bacterium]